MCNDMRFNAYWSLRGGPNIVLRRGGRRRSSGHRDAADTAVTSSAHFTHDGCAVHHTRRDTAEACAKRKQRDRLGDAEYRRKLDDLVTGLLALPKEKMADGLATLRAKLTALQFEDLRAIIDQRRETLRRSAGADQPTTEAPSWPRGAWGTANNAPGTV